MFTRVVEGLLILFISYIFVRLFIDILKRLPVFVNNLPQKVGKLFSSPKNLVTIMAVLAALLIAIDADARARAPVILFMIFLAVWLRRWIRTNFRL